MSKYELYSLKDLMEDFYISELSTFLELEYDKIDYRDSQEIIIDGKPFETLLSVMNTSKKEVFKKVRQA